MIKYFEKLCFHSYIQNSFRNPDVIPEIVCRGFCQPEASMLENKVVFIYVVGKKKKQDGFRGKTVLGITPEALT